LAPYGDIEELKVERCFAIAVTPRLKGGGKKKETQKPEMSRQSTKPSLRQQVRL